MAQLIDGKALAEKVRQKLAQEILKLKRKKITPGLAVLLVGKDPASQVYVRNKIAACDKIGIASFPHFLSEKTSEKKLIQWIDQLNRDPKVHGILLQLPLPSRLNAHKILERIDPRKDVDGLHSYNLGRLASGDPTFLPCTPAGILEMLDEIGFDCAGKQAVVIGRSNIVGKPVALLLLARNATVTICHSKTQNLPEIVKKADLVIAAVGVPRLVSGAWIKKGAVVIDVGTNRTAEGKLVGDVDFASVSKKASFLTPVPGGVGPMTITMLLKNTVGSAKQS